MEDAASSTNGTAAPSTTEQDVTTSKPTTETDASSSTKPMTKEQATEFAMGLLVQGRRHLLVSDIPNAIAALAESSQMLGEHYGEFADECAESYYYYGIALLEMARLDPDVLGDAVEGGEKGDDESGEDEENEGEDDEAASEEGESSSKSTEVDDIEMKDEEKKPETSEKEDVTESKTSEEKNEVIPEASEKKDVTESKTSEEKKEVKPEASEEKKEVKPEASEEKDVTESKTSEERKEVKPEASEEKESKEVKKPKNETKGKSLKVVDSLEQKSEKNEDDDDDDEEEETEVTNLQLAWEVLELSKNIYKKQVETNPAAKPKLADALIRLAEVAIESENYTSAIEDLLSCLEIQTSSFPSDSRSLAETRYQLGVAYTFTTDFQEAIRNFKAAAAIIKTRIENLKHPKEKAASKEEPHVFYTVEGEIEELESLLPDITEKIADTIDLEAEAVRKVAENGADGAGPSTAESSAEVSTGFAAAAGSSNGHDASSSSKPALDITHLIRKKRKPDEAEATESASPAKKVCAEPDAV